MSKINHKEVTFNK